MVPEQSVVRPAGKVVYVVEDGKVAQRIVQTGYRQGGLIEITAGLAGGETVAVDGAGFLTNNANVAVSKPRGDKRHPGAPAVPDRGAAGRDQAHRPGREGRRDLTTAAR